MAGGTLSDRLGHRTGLALSTVLFVAGSVVCSIASSGGILILGRSIQGAAAAMLIPASMALITYLAQSPEHRARLLGVWGGLSGVAIALGPVLGGLLVRIFDWRIIFFVNMPLGISLLVLIVCATPAVPAHRTASTDVAGLALGMAWPTALTYGLIEGHSQGWGSTPVITAFLIALIGIVMFVVVVRLQHPMMLVRAFGSGVFASANLAAGALGFSLSAAYYFLSLFIQQVLGQDALNAGVGFLQAAIGFMLYGPVTGKLVGRVGPGVLVTAGLIAGSLGLLGLSVMGPETGYWRFWWAVALVGAGLGLALPPNTTQALVALPPERAGAASGTVETSMQLGTVLGIAALGSVQATELANALRSRLISEGVGEPQLGRAIGAATSNRPIDLARIAPEKLSEIVADAFSHGLRVTFVTGAVVSAITAVVALVLLQVNPRGSDPSAPVKWAQVSADRTILD